MITTTVPAQITNLEDKVAANLTLKQLLLLISSVFTDLIMVALIPLKFKINPPKLFLIFLVTGFMILAATKVKGKLILTWTILIARYLYKPKYYVFNKNDTYLRISKINTTNEIFKPKISINQ